MALAPIQPAGIGTSTAYKTQTKGGGGLAAEIATAPGATNEPIIFEPFPELAGNQYAVWLIATGASESWGGCDVYVSVDPGGDGGYERVGRIGAGGVQGVLTAQFLAGSDPDTTNTLSVDLSESLGSLTAGTTTDADKLLTVCWVADTTGATGELIAYSAATLTAAHQYDLDTYIRRGCYQTVNGDHLDGAKFGLVGLGTFRHRFPAHLIGTTVWFKLPAFNIFTAQFEDLDAVTPYSYTLTGVGVSNTGSAAGVCSTMVVLAGGVIDIDWGDLDSGCIVDCADWGDLDDPVDPLCIDMGDLEES